MTVHLKKLLDYESTQVICVWTCLAFLINDFIMVMLQVVTMFSRQKRVFLDREHQEIFKPFYYIQYIFCMHTYNINRNYATPFTKFYFVLTIFVNIFMLVIFCATIRYASFYDNSMSIINYVNYSQYMLCFMLLAFLNLYQNNYNFQLIVELQEICHRIRNTEDTKRLKIMSWLWCCAVVMYYAFLITVKLTTDEHWHWTRAISLVTIIIFEIKLANVAVVLYFLLFKLRKWRKILRNFITKNETDKEILDDLKVTFQKIISVFNLFKITFQTIVSIFQVLCQPTTLLFYAVFCCLSIIEEISSLT